MGMFENIFGGKTSNGKKLEKVEVPENSTDTIRYKDNPDVKVPARENGDVRAPDRAAANMNIRKIPETEGMRKKAEMDTLNAGERRGDAKNAFKDNPERKKEYEARREAMRTREEHKGSPLLEGEE